MTAVGLPLLLLVALTAARVVDARSVLVTVDPVTFELLVQGSDDPAWQPSPDAWASGEVPVVVDLGDGGPSSLLPGESLRVRLAVLNASGAGADVVLSTYDPDPGGTTPDLYDGLRSSLLVDGEVVAVAEPGDDLVAPLGAPLGSGAQQVVELVLELPAEGSGSYAGAASGFGISVRGESR